MRSSTLLGSSETIFSNSAMAWSRTLPEGEDEETRVLAFAELAEIDAAKQLVGVNVVGRSLEQIVGGRFGVAHAAGSEIEIGEPVVQLGRIGVGIQRGFVLLDGVRDLVLAAFGNGIVFIHSSQSGVEVGSGTIDVRRIAG